MVTDSPVKVMSRMRPMIGGGGEGLEEELGVMLREQRRQDVIDRERELNLYRSGSAPPTVEGSLAAVGGLFGRDSEELRSDPAYLSYYYSNVNLNPRLPPPVISKEDWRSAQRIQTGGSALGGIGDKRKNSRGGEQGSSSLFSLQPGFNPHEEEGKVDSGEPADSGEWMDRRGDGLIGLPGFPLGRQKSFADIFQDDLGLTTPISSHPSRPASRNAYGDGIDTLGSVEPQLALHHETGPLYSPQPCGNIRSAGGIQNNGESISHTFASVLGKSLSRSTTPDPQLVARSPSPCLPPVGARLGNTDKKNNNSSRSFNGVTSGMIESEDLVAALSGMSFSTTGGIDKDNIAQSKLQGEIDNQQKFLFDSQGAQHHIKQHVLLKNPDPGHLSMSSGPRLTKPSYPDFTRKTGNLLDLSSSATRPNREVEPHKPANSSANSYLNAHSVTSPAGSPIQYPSTDSVTAAFTNYGLSGYSTSSALQSMMANQIGTSNLPPLFENAAAASAIGPPGVDSRAIGGFRSGSNLSGAADLQNLVGFGNHTSPAALQMPLVDPLYLQYLKSAEYAPQLASNYVDPSMGYMGNSYMDLIGMQKAYNGALLQSQEQYDLSFLGKNGGLNNGYYCNPAFGLGMSYPGGPLASPLPASPAGPGSPLRHGDRNMRFPSAMRNFSGGVMGSWRSDTSGNLDDGFPPSLLEEFKSSKTKCYELSEIAGHVVEFSADQYGSRFIQQKLETATTEEKNIVFEEIMPQAFSLITDVFGNYVIQKFFEHGSAAQRRKLADQLIGHVLTLSLQMYGCRVIQKAIEVVDLDQQTKMVQELNGHVMRCVRDQNGNHVIQKCIECIPQDAIQFIISSFYDQVVMLSTHPYGCRVIQRVLEYCDEPKTQQIMMNEIMGSVCMLAQDQYGNYVVQHVLEHGKPHERSVIIKKLAGQIVQMSQQKFASNVVEKCLTFGGPVERQILVNEMLGSTDENEPLQAMMKDQFANYVVQKVLETCDDQNRELILSRIKVHLNALKKYTYGKHIVARVEKLVAAGERRIGVQSSYTP